MRKLLAIVLLAAGVVFLACLLLRRGVLVDARASFDQSAKPVEMRKLAVSPLPDQPHAAHAPVVPVQNATTSLEFVSHQTSVVGVAFSLSASIEASCKRKELEFCESQLHALAEMAKEPRDKAWAAKTEALIQDYVLSQGPEIYSIRNIECRSSICAVEIQSLGDPYIGASYNFLATNGLVDGFQIFGAPEPDNSGHRISVTLVLFIRSAYKNPAKLPGTR